MKVQLDPEEREQQMKKIEIIKKKKASAQSAVKISRNGAKIDGMVSARVKVGETVSMHMIREKAQQLCDNKKFKARNGWFPKSCKRTPTYIIQTMSNSFEECKCQPKKSDNWEKSKNIN